MKLSVWRFDEGGVGTTLAFPAAFRKQDEHDENDENENQNGQAAFVHFSLLSRRRV